MMKKNVNNQIKWVAILSVALCTVLQVFPVQALEFSASEKTRLTQGKTVIRLLPSSGKNGFYGGAGYALIDAPVADVWRAIQDWGAYTRMFPNTEQCRPVSRKGNTTLLKMKIGHPVVSIRYHVQAEADDDKKSLRFNLVSSYPHDLDGLHGYWRLFPQKGGKTLAAYVVSVKAPAGIVAIAGEDLANGAIRALLSIPRDVNKWLKKNPYKR